ncbi:DUF4173 domain-containing protein [Maribacter algarum]|uniref:DUF4173 domain-containing protein n=1 Tax=Maribacter algarum (ex Zhang et al. 2020) TaxID=2578118 RepID=A0A5S3PSN3_9FLAO|nr:DUF4173 domain-containing protein [Maribacter algarum]TMM57999.1 DUF4173 domain-containing protein [Maribacter algarum]
MNVHIKSILSALAFSILFYSKSFGLNLFLISILVVVLVSTLRKQHSISWGYALAYVGTAVFVFLNPSGFTIFVHFMTFMVFVGKSISQKSSLYLTWFLGCINLIIGSVANYMQKQENEQGQEKKEKKDISPKLFNRLKGGLAALALLFIFGMLYRNANPVFGNLIERINLDFISFPWLFFTLLGYIIFLHLLRPFDAKELVAFDLAQTNNLKKPTEIVLIGEKKKLEGEHTLGSMIFIALNLLLLFFLTTDVIYLFQKTEISNSGLSQSVHQGVYALMFSIVCAIALILYFFRGNLNFFQGNKRIKSLTYIWIGLNVILVAFTAYKNYTYVETLGLTYKRIGVFVYLLLTLIGLVTAYVKVAQVKNFIYLVRTNIATVFAFLIVSAAIPWDKTITWYNLNTIENPDIHYLIWLGQSNSEQLYEYTKANATKLEIKTKDRIEKKYETFVQAQSEKTWQEYTLYQIAKNDTK